MDKPFNPQEGITHVPYPRAVVEWVDKALDMKRGLECQDFVEGDNEWRLVEFLFKGWQILYPEEAADFDKSVRYIRAITIHNGVTKDKGGATMQHQLEIPAGFYQIFRTMFPLQNWDRKFVPKFIKHFPGWQIGT